MTLDGTGSSDPESEALSYEWSLEDAVVRTGATPSYPAPTQLVEDEVLEFSLVVRDARGLASTAADTVTVTVKAGPNDAPTAHAGDDQGEVQEGAAVTLDGTGSSDPESEALSYEWSLEDAVVRTGATPSYPAPTQLVEDEVLEFSLVVRDARGLASTAADTVTVTVKAGPNDAPTAHAGDDQGEVQEGAAVTLDGTGSSDPESEALSYEWSLEDAVVRTGATPSYPAPTQLVEDEVLEFSLVVRDARGLASTAADTVTVTVKAGPNDAPTAHAGDDQGEVQEGRRGDAGRHRQQRPGERGVELRVEPDTRHADGEAEQHHGGHTEFHGADATGRGRGFGVFAGGEGCTRPGLDGGGHGDGHGGGGAQRRPDRGGGH